MASHLHGIVCCAAQESDYSRNPVSEEDTLVLILSPMPVPRVSSFVVSVLPLSLHSRTIFCVCHAAIRADSPAGDVDSHNIVCSWCAQAHVPIHSCDFTNGHFQGQKIDRILLYRISAEGFPGDGIAGGEILASRVPVYGSNDAGRGLCLRLKNTCRQFKILIEPNSASFVHASKR